MCRQTEGVVVPIRHYRNSPGEKEVSLPTLGVAHRWQAVLGVRFGFSWVFRFGLCDGRYL